MRKVGSMKTYLVYRTTGGVRADIVEDGVTSRLKHIVRHSPTGLEFGYGGSGPADTALSILTDLLGPEIAGRFYQHFKWDFIAQARENVLTITEQQIRAWLVVAEHKYQGALN